MFPPPPGPLFIILSNTSQAKIFHIVLSQGIFLGIFTENFFPGVNIGFSKGFPRSLWAPLGAQGLSYTSYILVYARKWGEGGRRKCAVCRKEKLFEGGEDIGFSLELSSLKFPRSRHPPPLGAPRLGSPPSFSIAIY